MSDFNVALGARPRLRAYACACDDLCVVHRQIREDCHEQQTTGTAGHELQTTGTAGGGAYRAPDPDPYPWTVPARDQVVGMRCESGLHGRCGVCAAAIPRSGAISWRYGWPAWLHPYDASGDVVAIS